MRKLPLQHTLHVSRSLLILAAFAVLLALTSPSATAATQTKNKDLAARPDFREPVVLASKDGVLEVRLTARQGKATLDTVATPVENFLLFDYEVIHGSASNGQRSGGNLYPAPTLQVFPGERLIVHFENALTGLTIRDYFIPQYTAKGQPVPVYPEQMTSSPINLHTHGAHISPKGNADNVMLHIPPGMSNTYTYNMPRNMPQGLFWYHCHLHGLTSAQGYAGLVGLLHVGRTDGNLPLVTKKNIPVRNIALQYNFVFDRAGGLAQLNNPNWSQWVNSASPPKPGELANGTYRPSFAPVNFNQSKVGTQYFTVWYAGPLSINNHRGQLEFIPSNLQQFTAADGKPDSDVPANPALPDYQRDVQFTVNGQFQPAIKSKADQTEIWVLANVSDFAYINVQLTETATGRHPPIAIVGQDGNPYPAVHYPPADKTRLLIPPASRFAIAVTIPAEGELILEMPERGRGAKTMTAPGVLYTNSGTDNPPAILGTLSVLPSAVSYADGFFIFPTQVLLRATAAEPGGLTTAFAEGQPLGGYTSYVDLSSSTPDFERQILISGGFLNSLASPQDPKAFVYAFDGIAFPNVPLIQPRLNSVEEWKFVNHNNDEHPIHVHVNDLQVTEYYDPTTGLRTGADRFGVDNANAPAPTMQIDESVIEPGILSIRTRFDAFTGLFVMHCHRLNHEDNGLMMLINVIPAISSYAVAVPGAPGKAAEVRVYDGNADRLLATVSPFPGYEGNVRIYGSKLPSSPGTAPALFSTFSPYDGDRSGISLTAGFVDYATGRYSIVTAPGPGLPAEVKVFAFSLLKPINNGGGHAGVHAAGPGQPANTASFKPFGDAYRGGVSLGTGWLAGSLGGAERIVVSQLADAGTVKVFSSGSALDDGPALYLRSPNEHGHAPIFREIASFNPFDGTSGTRVATTSTTTGADLLVSGVASQGQSASVVRYEFVRPHAQATTLQTRRLGEVFSAAGSQPPILGGH